MAGLLLGALSLVSSGCSPGDGAADNRDTETLEQRIELIDLAVPLAISLPASPDPMLEGLTPPADASSKGMWSVVRDWPLNGLHSTLLPNGRVLTYGTPSGAAATQDGRTFDVWDPTQGFTPLSHQTTFNAQRANSFCAGATFLADGSLLISGGNSPLDSSFFSTGTGTVTTAPFKMASDRWYGTLLTLPDGRALMMGGSGPYAALRAHVNPGQAVNAGTVSMTPEIYEPGTGFRSLFGAYSRDAFGPDHHRYWYPRAWVAPNGEVFGISSEKMWYLDPTGDGAVRVVGDFKAGVDATAKPNIGPTSTAVMFAPGQILQVGGNGYYDGHQTPSSALATVIDINGAEPVVTDVAPMNIARQWANATVLPNGQVVVTGGTRQANNGGVDAVYEAELWNPATGTWTMGARSAVIRVYHSAAILLPNGTVLSTGGGAPGPVNNLNAEVFYPPYLFRPVQGGGAELAPRPKVVAASTLAPTYGGTLNMDLASVTSIEKVALIGASSVTHSFNTSQRRLELPFVQSGGRVAVSLPTSAVEAPPGYYELFVLDSNGVPSPGVIISLGVTEEEPPTPTTFPRGSEVALESLNVVGSVVATDTQSLGVLKVLGASPSDADLLPTRFVVRDGLADAACVSFESVGRPGVWLRHYGYRLRLDPSAATALFREDATFCPEPGLAGSGFSFRSKNFPTRVIRHRDGQLWVDVVATTGTFPLDATFTVRRPPLPTLPSITAPIVAAGTPVTYAPSLAIAGANYSWDFGDGTQRTTESLAPNVTHTFVAPGVYLVTLSIRLADGRTLTKTFVQAVRAATLTTTARSSTMMALSTGIPNPRLWVVDPDNDLLTVFDASSFLRVGELVVCSGPRSVAVADDQNIWVACRDDATITVVHPTSLSIVQRAQLPSASRPYGLVIAPGAGRAYVSLEGLGTVAELDAVTTVTRRTFQVGSTPRGLALTSDGARLLVSRFISPPIDAEATFAPLTESARGEVWVVPVGGGGTSRILSLAHSNLVDNSVQGRGVPNYLGAPVISPDGASAWIPSKQDNIARGIGRDGQQLDFQNTVRAISSRIDLDAETEVLGARLDHDNSGLAAAATFHPSGVYLFVALETSREVAVVNAIGGVELFRINVGRAPQALLLSQDGQRLFVKNFMDRSVSVIDLSPLVENGEFAGVLLATLSSASAERLSPQILLGKQLFYDAKDPRLARDAYISCASCHAEGGQDGRVWDLSGQGEGLRNTISLIGRSGASRGPLHWSGNFDEVQDFEGQIRGLAGGTGLLSDALYSSGTVSDPLGDRKTGLSSDLDALAAYVTALGQPTPSPFRNGTQLTADGLLGRQVFLNAGCNECHYGVSFSDEERRGLVDVGTMRASSGQRLFGPLLGIDVPSLLDVWNTPPYLHDGSAASVRDAILAHSGVSFTSTELSHVASYVSQIDGREPALPKMGCADGATNGSESDVDCGGSCGACSPGKTCRSASDCSSLLCENFVCVAQATCTDGRTNGDESDVDCGGGCPLACPLGSACWTDVDCDSNVCESGICASQASCEDGVRNQDESDVDCGGVCLSCELGASCTKETDCRSGLCMNARCMPRPSCTDGIRNQNESDTDCGGLCSHCSIGGRCNGPADCMSGVCTGGICRAAATCSDGIKNQNESDTDCGGVCADCANGKACGSAGDCVSGVCTGGICRAAATCSDGIKNQNESDTDCGGVCADCANGKACGSAGDCVSGVCTGGICRAPSVSPVQAAIRYQSEWSTGYCADLTITNTSTATINTWTVVLNTNQSMINNGWSANFSGTGSTRTVTPLSWNAVLPRNGSTVVGFCADKLGSNWRPTVTSTR